MITTDTVHDHLKVVYRKTGTNGRGPLRHRLVLDTWAQAHSGCVNDRTAAVGRN